MGETGNVADVNRRAKYLDLQTHLESIGPSPPADDALSESHSIVGKQRSKDNVAPMNSEYVHV